jgi:ubiquinone/menaquinone biosynthesis C-methylase UbiE
VDLVGNAHELPFDEASFDHVLCLEMLEHDEQFWVSIGEMKRVLRRGGSLVITTRGFHFPRHDYPSDYYRFSPEALTRLMQSIDMRAIKTRECQADHGVYVRAVKP